MNTLDPGVYGDWGACQIRDAIVADILLRYMDEYSDHVDTGLTVNGKIILDAEVLWHGWTRYEVRVSTPGIGCAFYTGVVEDSGKWIGTGLNVTDPRCGNGL